MIITHIKIGRIIKIKVSDMEYKVKFILSILYLYMNSKQTRGRKTPYRSLKLVVLVPRKLLCLESCLWIKKTGQTEYFICCISLHHKTGNHEAFSERQKSFYTRNMQEAVNQYCLVELIQQLEIPLLKI